MSDAQRSRLEISDYLVRFIHEHQLTAHDPLPSENDLAAKFGLNRNIVRGAVDRLCAQGRIYAHKGKGFFVSPTQAAVVYPPNSPMSGFRRHSKTRDTSIGASRFKCSALGKQKCLESR